MVARSACDRGAAGPRPSGPRSARPINSLRLLLCPHNLGRQRFHLLADRSRPLPSSSADADSRRRPPTARRGFQLVDLHAARLGRAVPRVFVTLSSGQHLRAWPARRGRHSAHVPCAAEALTGHALRHRGVVEKGSHVEFSEANEAPRRVAGRANPKLPIAPFAVGKPY